MNNMQIMLALLKLRKLFEERNEPPEHIIVLHEVALALGLSDIEAAYCAGFYNELFHLATEYKALWIAVKRGQSNG
jgi:hypothetical protein